MAGERGQFDGVTSSRIIITDEAETELTPVVELWIAKVVALDGRGYKLRRWPEPKPKDNSMVVRGRDSSSLMKLRWGLRAGLGYRRDRPSPRAPKFFF